jgi:membrane-associated protein
VTLIIFVETAFLITSFLPGDSLLFITGLTVATLPSIIPPWLAFVLVLAAAIGGTQVGYEIGRAVGPPLLRRRRWPLTENVVARTTSVFERLGARAVIIGRFIPILRALVPVLAGITGMPRRRFVMLNVIGAFAWVGVFMLGGFLLGQVPFVKENLELAVIVVVIVSSLPFPIELWRDARRRRKESVVGGDEDPANGVQESDSFS